MKKKVLSLVLAAALLVGAAAPSAPAQALGETGSHTAETPLKLWYDEPAENTHTGWERTALPVGNGHMGAMVFGRTDTERIQLNEETLWTGGPGGDYTSYNTDEFGNVTLDDPAATMSGIIDRAFEQMYAGSTSSVQPSAFLPSKRYQLGNYQNFAETYIDYNHSGAADYSRELDLRTGKTSERYVSGGVQYTRELFASHEDNVLVYRVSASQAGALTFTLHPEIPDMTTSSDDFKDTADVNAWDISAYGKTGAVTAAGDTITLKGALKQNGLKFEGQYKVIPTGGSLSASNDGGNGKITVTGADSAVILIALGTDYENVYPAYRGEDPHAGVSARISTAAALGYSRLYDRHEADYTGLFDRVDLNLGGNFPAGQTTDELLSSYKSGTHNAYLETLYYQYGRYLLISSSREDTLPANLQGVWNDQVAPRWQSDYHNNINLQMNYWPAYVTNLSETADALVNYIDSLRAPGRVTFQKIFGIQPQNGDTESGWFLNVSSNIFGHTGNINATASFTPSAVAFICQNLYDYYAFTKDKDFLKDRLYPILKESCKTYLQTLQPGRTDADKDKLYVAPSYSSEQGPWTVGASFDQQLVYQLFHDTALCADALGGDDAFAAELRETMEKLDPVRVGDSGQIKEWQQEGAYNTTVNGTKLGDPTHRHNSQLVALYPGNQITMQTPELMKAAKVTLTLRGDEATGWSMGHKLNLWARTGDGDHAYKLLNNLLSKGTYNNLFDYHPPYQIDGNFGGTSGISEMLLQSHAGYVELLPALPQAWSTGSYKGLVARGNFEISADWNNGVASSASVLSQSGGTLTLNYNGLSKAKVTRVSDGKTVAVTKTDSNTIAWDTVKGETYQITEIPQERKVSQPTELLNATFDNLYNKSVMIDTGMSTDEGVFLSALAGGSAFARAGFEQNDVVCELNGAKTADINAFSAAYNEAEESAALTFRVWRATGFTTLTMKKDSTDTAVHMPVRLEAEDYTEIHGSAKAEDCVEGGQNIGFVQAGDYLVFKGLIFDKIPSTFSARAASSGSSGHIVVHLGSLDGPVVADLKPSSTGSWKTYQTFTGNMTGTESMLGPQDLYIVLTSVNLNWMEFGTNAKSDLETLAAQAAKLQPLDYTTATARELSKALKEAQDLLKKDDATESQLSKTMEKLQTAMDGLQKRGVEYSYALSALHYADSLAATDYASAAGWSGVQPKRNALAALLGDESAAMSSINAAADALVPLLNGLSISTASKTLDDKDSSIRYGYGTSGPDTGAGHEGAWYDYNGSKYLSGSSHNCRSAGAWAEMTFTGSRVAYLTEKAQGSSYVEVYIDGNLIDTIDTYDGGDGLAQAVVFDTTNYPELALTEGTHTMKLVTLAEKNPLSNDYLFRVDGFRIYSGSKTVADTTALFADIKTAAAKEEASYTPSTWALFEEAMARATALFRSGSELSPSAITAARGDVADAAALLTERANTAALSEAYEKNKGKAESDYTAQTWAPFQRALNDAKDLLRNPEATQKRVDDAKTELEKTAAALEKAEIFLKDSDAGVTVSAPNGVLPNNATLKAAALSGKELSTVKEALSSIGTNVAAWEASLLQNGVEIQPNGEITVTLIIPNGFDTNRLSLYRLQNDGSKSEISFTLAGGSVRFTVSQAGRFALVERSGSSSGGSSSEGSSSGTPSENPSQGGSGTGSSSGTSSGNGTPTTGEAAASSLTLVLFAALLACTALVFLAVRRRKHA